MTEVASHQGGASSKHRLTELTGLAGLSLDALASVAYGPESIVLVLALAGGAGLGFTLPVTIAIAVLLMVLTISYRQVIAAFPDGGGAYGVSKRYLGRSASLLAASSLFVDYTLNVAVSVATGVASLTSAFPALLGYTIPLCLGVLGIITAINYRGILGSARAFALPTAVYVASLVLVIIVGMIRNSPAATVGVAANSGSLQAVGVLLILRAFSNGCSALTGVEAIANAVPSFKAPAVRRAQRAEVVLGITLGVLLLGIAHLIGKFDIHPRGGVTVLSQVTAASLGTGPIFVVVQISTLVLVALAANTSFGGMPVLARLLANDNFLPHLFGLRAERQVHRYGIGVLAGLSALLLVVARGQMNVLVPLFAVGVFVGFTLSQIGMVKHWVLDQPQGWRSRAVLNGVGALLTAAAAVVLTASKFLEGAWLIVLVLPVLMLTMRGVKRAYSSIGRSLGVGLPPPTPTPQHRCVVVPVQDINRLSSVALSAAKSLGDEVIAVHVVDPQDPDKSRRLADNWHRWQPGMDLKLLHPDEHLRLAEPIVEFVRTYQPPPVVLIPEIEPRHGWQRILQNQRGAVIDRALRKHTDALICRLRFRLNELEGSQE